MEQWCSPHQYMQDQCWRGCSWWLLVCGGWPGWCLLPQHCWKVFKRVRNGREKARWNLSEWFQKGNGIVECICCCPYVKVNGSYVVASGMIPKRTNGLEWPPWAQGALGWLWLFSGVSFMPLEALMGRPLWTQVFPLWQLLTSKYLFLPIRSCWRTFDLIFSMFWRELDSTFTWVCLYTYDKMGRR